MMDGGDRPELNPSDLATGRTLGGLSRRVTLALVAVAVLFLATRGFLLPRSPDDLDSVNFALGIRQFDVAAHRPHPPGYPVLIGLAKATVATRQAVPGISSEPAFMQEAQALGLLALIAGAMLIPVLPRLFLGFEAPEPSSGSTFRAVAATGLVVASPLFWLTAGRPMSDVPGLLGTFAAMAMLAAAWRQQQAMTGSGTGLPSEASPTARSGRLIVLGAFTAGLAIGVRSQVVWLAIPLLLVVLLTRAGRGAAGALLGASITLTFGVLLWAVPLVVASGGVGGYLAAVSVQAGEDFTDVGMLLFNPSPRRVAFALIDTFVGPWHAPWLGWTMVALGLVGVWAMLVQNRRGLLALLVAFVPYGVFHLAFHDTTYVRYALPLVIPVAYLAVWGLTALLRAAAPVVAAVLVIVALALSVPIGFAYAQEASPVYRAYADLAARVAEPGTVAMHHAVSRALRGESLPVRRLESPLRHEWLEIARYWRQGGIGPVWLLADSTRTDIAAIDPASRRVVNTFRWGFPHLPLFKGLRPDEVDLLELRPPGWVALEGWALTPELAGVAFRDRKGPALGPIEAIVRGRAEPGILMIGGRNLGKSGDPDVRFTLTIDGRTIDTWTTPTDPAFFLRFRPLDPTALGGGEGFASLQVTAEAADGSARPVQAAVEQFDVQPTDAVVYGFDRGWHEQEFDPVRGRGWRWTSETAVTRIHHGGHDLRLTLEGESPLASFERPSGVTIRAGDAVLARAALADDFSLSVSVPAAALDRAGGELTLETDQTFLPADRRHGSADRRSLGLRILRLTLEKASGVR